MIPGSKSKGLGILIRKKSPYKHALSRWLGSQDSTSQGLPEKLQGLPEPHPERQEATHFIHQLPLHCWGLLPRWGGVLTLLAAFVHGDKEAPTALGKKQNRKPQGWSHWKDWQSEASLDLWETVQHTYSWNQRRTKGMWWCSSSSHSAFHPQNLDQCLEHGKCSINNSEKEKKYLHSKNTLNSYYGLSLQMFNSITEFLPSNFTGFPDQKLFFFF